MNTHADKTSENKSKANANSLSKLQANRESSVQFIDNRPKAITQGEIHEMANNKSASFAAEIFSGNGQ